MYYYIGTVILQMTPREFWHSTPRKLSALVKIHAELNAPQKYTPPGTQGHMSRPRLGGGAQSTGGIANSLPRGQGVGSPNAYVDQVF